MEEKKKVTTTKKKAPAKKKTTNRISKKTEQVIKSKEVEHRRVQSEKTSEVKLKEEVIKEDKVEKKEKQATTFNLFEVIIIMLITAFFGIVVGSCVAYFKDNVIDNNNIPKDLREFVEVYYDLSNDYYKSQDLDKKELLDAGIDGMLKYLDDQYSVYIEKENTDAINEELEGEFFGMGATITVDDQHQIYIVEILKDTPAEKLGFLPGDYIVKVGDEVVSDYTVDQVAALIKGEDGTKVDVTILRNGEQKVITLVRGKVVLQSVCYNMIENTKIGYIDISIFAENTDEQFKEAVEELKKQGAESIIIDVRDNSGGYITTAKEIASLFLKKGSTIYQLASKGTVEKIKNEKDPLYNFDIAVLSNSGSASAAEMLTAALNDNLGSPIVGIRSFGKGTIQDVRKLSSGAMIKYTTQEWYTPNGNKVNGSGIEPTYKVEQADSYYANPTNDTDVQLQKAIEILKK